MKKLIPCIFLLSLILVACSDNTGSEGAVEEEAETIKTNVEVSDPEQLIGEHITMVESSIELPFDDLVTEAHFSEDGSVKVFVTEDLVLVIDDTEIVHSVAVETAHIHASPTVSADGKYAIWRKNARQDDYTITIFNVENRTVDYVESTEKYDVYGVYLYLPLIENVDDEYYLVTNNYLYGDDDVAMTLNLTTKEMYSNQYPEDQEVLSKLKQDPIFSGDETYIPMVETWAHQNNLNGVDSSYYGYYGYLFEAGLEDDTSIEQLYAVYTPEPKIIDLELDKHGIDLADENKEIYHQNDILIADNGSLIFTQYEQDEKEEFKMYTYYIDLANTSVEPILVHESEFDGDKKDVLFNHDAQGIYIVEEGKLNLVELK